MEQPNLDYINDLAGDDEAFRAKLVATIKAELPGEIEAYETSYNSADYKAAVGHVHKLKHKISILGLEKSYYLAADFEDELKNNKTSLATDFERVLHTIKDFAASL
jgi:HPt (histidine-containing phosphotransfer) domain-containing protein